MIAGIAASIWIAIGQPYHAIAVDPGQDNPFNRITDCASGGPITNTAAGGNRAMTQTTIEQVSAFGMATNGTA